MRRLHPQVSDSEMMAGPTDAIQAMVWVRFGLPCNTIMARVTITLLRDSCTIDEAKI